MTPAEILAEITNGPLSAEIAPHITNKDAAAIYAILSRKDISTLGFIDRDQMNTWAVIHDERSNIEDHANNPVSPARSAALALRDVLQGGSDGLHLEYPEILALVEAWPYRDQMAKTDLESRATVLVSRADQLGYPITLLMIRDAIGSSAWSTEIVSSVVETSGALLVTANFSRGVEVFQRSVQVFSPTAASINEALRRERMLLESALAVALPVGTVNIDAA